MGSWRFFLQFKHVFVILESSSLEGRVHDSETEGTIKE